MAIDHAVGGLAALGLSTTGILAAGAMGPMNLPMGDLFDISLFAVGGAIARAFLDAKADRDAAAKSGVKHDDLPEIDLVSLGYAILGAPFVGAMTYAIARWMGVSQDYIIIAIIVGMGYLGRDGINWIISIVQKIIATRIGG